jgi:hypothetical protein
MAKFLEARFIKDSDGKLIMGRPMELPRMTLEGAAQRGYRKLEHGELARSNIKSLDYGFAVLKTSRGELRAVRVVE